MWNSGFYSAPTVWTVTAALFRKDCSQFTTIASPLALLTYFICLLLSPFEFASFGLYASFIGCHASIQSPGIADEQAWLQYGSGTVYFC